jgi:hypothetical protein
MIAVSRETIQLHFGQAHLVSVRVVIYLILIQLRLVYMNIRSYVKHYVEKRSLFCKM